MKARIQNLCIAVFGIFSASVSNANAGVVSWTNTVGGLWSEVANWDSNQVPDVSDIAAITNDGNYSVTMDISPTVSGLTLGLAGSTNVQNLTGDYCTVNGQIVINPSGRFILHHALTGTNQLSGAMTVWTGSVFGGFSGFMSGRTTISSNGVLNLDGNASGINGGFGFFDFVLTNYGTVNLTNVYIGGYLARVENYGAWNARGDSTLYPDIAGNFHFENFGIFNASMDTNTAYITADFDNWGTMEIQSGALIIQGAGTYKGTANVESGANFFLNGYAYTNVFDNPTFTGSGGVFIQSAIFGSGIITASNLQLIWPGTLMGTNTLIGTLACGGLLKGTFTVASNSTLVAAPDLINNNSPQFTGLILTNYGTTIWTIFPADAVQIYNYGLWDAQSDNSLGSGGGVFNNFGTFRKSSGTNTSTVDRSVAFNNFGIVDVETGTLAIEGGGTNTGAFNANTGCAISFSDQFGHGYTFNEGATLTGDDVSIQGDVFINGSVSAQNVQFRYGILNFGLSSPTNFGRLNVSGTVAYLNNRNLAATLRNGFLPATNLSFQVMTFGATNGTFTDFSGLNVGNGRYFKPIFSGNDLTLQTRQAPTANPDTITVTVNTSTNIPVLANDTDAYGLPLALMDVTQGVHGEVGNNGNGTVHYQPATNYLGSDSFTYVVSNGDGGSSTGLVTVTVVPVSSGGNSNASVTLTTLHYFTGSDGATAYSPLLQASDGKLYGMTYMGGANNLGSIFDLTLGGVFSNLFSFNGSNGSSAFGSLAEGSDGNLYGTTQTGGVYGPQFNTTIGTLFRFTFGGQFSNLVFFTVTNGMIGGGGLIRASDGELYGNTGAGGTNNTANAGGNPVPSGNLFRVGTNGLLTTIANLNATNGAFPQAPLAAGSDGYLYGTASGGGVAFTGNIYSGHGSVFRTATNGGLTLLALFQGTNGSNPYNSGLVQGQDGSFYGMTRYGGTGFVNGQAGSGYGTIYRITTNGTVTSLFKFNGTNGSQPLGSLIQTTGGILLGTTSFGGNGFTGANSSGNGTIFQITTNGEFTKLYSFSGPDGKSPYAGLTAASDGNYYGTTAYGGTNNAGTIFRLRFVAASPLLTISHSGNTVTITWPYPSTGWTLQQNGNLATTNWSTSGGISNDGTNNLISITPPTGNLFFRLKQ